MHKGNIMKFTEGAFRNWGYALAEREFADQIYTWDQWERTKAAKGEKAANDEQRPRRRGGKVIVKDAIADITLQQVLTRPEEFDVIATMNLNGDYLSDALAAQVGGIGIAPGGNVNYVTGHAVFEATHGTAPKYANLDKVNPGSVILSGEMMLRYMGWTEAADAVITAMDRTIAQKTVTYDFARLMEGATEVKCSEFGDALIRNLLSGRRAQADCARRDRAAFARYNADFRASRAARRQRFEIARLARQPARCRRAHRTLRPPSSTQSIATLRQRLGDACARPALWIDAQAALRAA